ncbi:MAG: helix-turn-helix domain-containing protein [Verrucomicrobiota bacterium]
MKLGERLEKWLKEPGNTQMGIAEATGISQGAINNYLQGRTPKADELSKLADFFRCSTDELIGRKISWGGMERGDPVVEMSVAIKEAETPYGRKAPDPVLEQAALGNFLDQLGRLQEQIKLTMEAGMRLKKGDPSQFTEVLASAQQRKKHREEKMKNIIGLLLLSALCAGDVFGGLADSGVAPADNPLNHIQPIQPVLTAMDPNRELNGVVYRAEGIDEANGWVAFEGEVIEVQPGGVRLRGDYHGAPGGLFYGPDAEFFVANYPYDVAEGESVGPSERTLTFPLAKISGTYTYPTAIGGSHTIRKLDYGRVWTPPPLTPEQIAEQKAAAEKRKAEAAKKVEEAKARALKQNQDAADKGDAYGLLRMGERYRDGDGVPKDLDKARDYLTKASAAGSPTAADDLKSLPK